MEKLEQIKDFFSLIGAISMIFLFISTICFICADKKQKEIIDKQNEILIKQIEKSLNK